MPEFLLLVLRVPETMFLMLLSPHIPIREREEMVLRWDSFVDRLCGWVRSHNDLCLLAHLV